MTLTTHGVVGAGVMIAFSNNPIAGGVFAFGSHFLLDFLPHLDYKILSLDTELHKQTKAVKIKWGSRVFLDLLRIGIDFILGLTGALIIYIWFNHISISFWLILLGAILGMLPDLLQFVYGQIGGKILEFVQKIHNFTHTSFKLENQVFIGVLSQLGLIGLIFICLNFL